jgi:hypothetical protein
MTNFRIAYQSLETGEELSFPADNVQARWADHLSTLADDKQAGDLVEFWKSQFKSCGPAEAAIPPLASTAEQSLSVEESAEVFRHLPRLKLSFEELCLVGLLSAHRQSFNEQRVQLLMEWNGRPQVANGLDLTRGIGWFALYYPAIFRVDTDIDQAALMQDIVIQHRNLFDKRETYSVLRFLNPATAKALGGVEDWRSSICFACLGDLGGRPEADEIIMFKPECLAVSIELIRSLGRGSVMNPRSKNRFDIAFYVMNQAIHIGVTFNPDRDKREEIEAFLLELKQSLLEVIKLPQSNDGHAAASLVQAG